MESFREAWNSPLMQGIRSELLEGRFHDYCLRSPGCPIVRKSEQARVLPVRQQVILKMRHAWARFDRRLGGVPNRVWRPIKWSGQAAGHAIVDPGWAVRRVRERLGSAPPNSASR
jgi:hypothetical protein